MKHLKTYKLFESFVFTYRLATNEDYPMIKKIANQWKSELGFVMRVAIEDAIKRDEVIVCMNYDNLIGFVHFHKRKDGYNTIHEIGVDRAFINKGIGKELFNRVPFPRQLKTTTDNIKANEFYKRMGMNLVGVEDGKKRKLNFWQDNKFFESINSDKIYQNIDISDYDVYYQIPFKWFDDNKEFGDDYKLHFGQNFIYDYIKDEEIKKELNKNLNDIDLSKSWESETKHSSDNYNLIHTKRVAKLVKNIQENKPLKPISFWISEESYIHDCYNFIEDGNHRIRALQYLKYTHFPAFVYGSHANFVIKELNG